MNEPLFYPPCVYHAASEAERPSILEENAEFLDVEAARLLDIIADCEAGLWADRAHARRCRKVLRSVSDWLRQRR